LSSLVVLATSVFETSCGKTDTDTQTNASKKPTPPHVGDGKESGYRKRSVHIHNTLTTGTG